MMDAPDSQHFQFAMQVEIGHRHLTASMDGQPTSRLLGKFTEWTGGWTHMNMNPLSHAVMYDDYVQLIIYTPIDVTRAVAEMIWLVHEDAVESVDYDFKKLTDLMRVTMYEDKKITDDSQPGLSSSAYRPGVLAGDEYRVVEFHHWYFNNIVDAA